MTSKGKWLRVILWTGAGLFTLFVLLMICLQLVLSPKVCTSLIQKYYPEFIDGKLSLKEASVSVFSHFPAVTLNIDDFLITYPSRFAGDSTDRDRVANFMELAGSCRNLSDSAAPRMDTLAYFRKFSASINVLTILSGNLRVKNLEFQRPTAYIHVYADSTSNLDIIKIPTTEDSANDSSSFVLRSLVVKKLFVGSRSKIVYTDRRNDLYALLHLQRCDFKGNLSASDPLSNNLDLGIDSLLVSGSYNADTLLFSLDHLGLKNEDAKTDLDARAKVFVATKSFGRIGLPVGVAASLQLEDLENGHHLATLDNVKIDFASIHADAQLQADLADTIALKGWLELDSVVVQKTLDRLSEKLVPDLALLETDATVNARVDIDGYYFKGMQGLPAMTLSVDIPNAHAGIVGTELVSELDFHARAEAQQCSKIDVHLAKFSLKAPGMECAVTGDLKDALGKDPWVSVNMLLDASVRDFMNKAGKILGMRGKGDLNAELKGSFNFSNLNLYNLGGVELSSKITLNGLDVSSKDDSLQLFCNNLSVLMGKNSTSGRHKALFGVKVAADSLLCLIKGQARMDGKNLVASAVASPRVLNAAEYLSYCPLRVSLNMDRALIQDEKGASIKIRSTKNSASIRPSKDTRAMPLIKFTSSNGKFRVNMGPHRFSLTNLAFDASAKMVDNTSRRERLNAFRDSLLRRHPTWNQDSLLANFKKKASKKQVPEWLSEEDFRKDDISFTLESSLRKLFSVWNFNGNIALEKARIRTPAFPLKTALTNFKGGFDNDNISLDTLRIISGASDLEASGKVTRLRRALMGRGIPKLKLEVRSDTIAFNELFGALAKGQANMEKDLSQLAAMNDETYESFAEKKEKEGLSEDDPKLIVVPANIDAEVLVRGRGMKYSTLDISSFTADLLMKRRCMLAKNITAKSNAGDFRLEAFYSTISKKKLTAGFDLNLSDIAAGQIISLIPSLDTLVPLLKSFDGYIDCNFSATASLDTNMNIIMPSLNGVARVTGTNLHFVDNKELNKLLGAAAIFMPKNAKIDSMKVEGMLKDNQFEIFPFILKMDWWTISLAGIQNVNKKFSYHASVIKSPLLFKFGANVYGDDFDHVNFKLGKPRFKKEDAIPSFSKAIDTTRINLLQSIRNIYNRNAEAVLRENNAQMELRRERARKNYQHSASLDALEELSDKDKSFADSLSRANQPSPAQRNTQQIK